jgi:deazaflavin-dependent oxidoreductase (nitroreductase family)
MDEYESANSLRRIMRRSGSLRPLSWFYARTLHHVDRPVFRLSGGRATFTSWVTGLPIVMLRTTGARSGLPRAPVPVVGIPDGECVVVIASNYAQQRNPAWYYNLCAHPRVDITIDGIEHEMVARELEGSERERYYARGIEIYPGWVEYRKRAAHREIPVIRLEPAGAPAEAARAG